MPESVQVSVSTLSHLRDVLLSFEGRQIAALDQMLAEVTRTQLELDEALDRARAELRRAEDELARCQAAAAVAATAGTAGPDCGGLSFRVSAARDRVDEVISALQSLANAVAEFRTIDSQHRSFLSSRIPAMKASLEAREISLEAYLSFVTSSGAAGPVPSAINASRALADDISAKQRFEAIRQPHPPEFREGNRGGPEQRG